MRSLGVLLFPEFELLDVFGPLEMYGILSEQFEIHLVGETRGAIASRQGPKSLIEREFSEAYQYDILLVPGGKGTRTAIHNKALLDWLRQQSTEAEYVTAVCTGSALLAKAGLLDHRRATTNKLAFNWVTTQGEQVMWQKKARWVEDGKFFTSAGVSAGIDMSLALIAKMLGAKTAEQTATWAEYDWHQDPNWDPFAEIHGLVDSSPRS